MRRFFVGTYTFIEFYEFAADESFKEKWHPIKHQMPSPKADDFF